jgi:hypothetical protein
MPPARLAIRGPASSGQVAAAFRLQQDGVAGHIEPMVHEHNYVRMSECQEVRKRGVSDILTL